jgi:hypothetical protein
VASCTCYGTAGDTVPIARQRMSHSKVPEFCAAHRRRLRINYSSAEVGGHFPKNLLRTKRMLQVEDCLVSELSFDPATATPATTILYTLSAARVRLLVRGRWPLRHTGILAALA